MIFVLLHRARVGALVLGRRVGNTTSPTGSTSVFVKHGLRATPTHLSTSTFNAFGKQVCVLLLLWLQHAPCAQRLAPSTDTAPERAWKGPQLCSSVCRANTFPVSKRLKSMTRETSHILSVFLKDCTPLSVPPWC